MSFTGKSPARGARTPRIKGKQAKTAEKIFQVNLCLCSGWGSRAWMSASSQESGRPGGETRSSTSPFLQSLDPGPCVAPCTDSRVSETPVRCAERTLDPAQGPGRRGQRLSSLLCSPCKPGSSPGPSAPAEAAGGPARPGGGPCLSSGPASCPACW